MTGPTRRQPISTSLLLLACLAGSFLLATRPARATPFTDTKITEGLIWKTVTGVHIEETKNTGDTYVASYTDMTGAAKTATGTAAAGTGLLDLHFSPKPGTNIVVKNTTETITNPAIVASADIFTPGSNVVVNAFAVSPGSSLSFGGSSFALAGGFTTVDTSVNYDPTSPAYGQLGGSVVAADLHGNGPAGTVVVALTGMPGYLLDLKSLWAAVIPVGDVGAGLSIPADLALTGTVIFNGSPVPFTGTFDGTLTVLADGSTIERGTLDLTTMLGEATGTLLATAESRLAPVAEPPGALVFVAGLSVLLIARRQRRC